MPRKAKPPSAPFDDHGFVEACRQLHAAIDQLDARVAKAVGISRNDLRCLNLLEREPLSPGQIAKALELTSGSVTSLLDRLESLELIERRPSPQDRRALLIFPTAASFRQIGPIYRQFAESLIQLSGTYAKHDRAVVLTALREIAQRCAQASETLDP
ncbi:MAG: MarR family transcriptional regulator [Pseudomonadota bacterium]